MSWAEPDKARSLWQEAPVDNDLLQSYLDAAHEQVKAYAPALPDGAEIPENYILAEVMQARAIYRSLRASRNDDIGMEGFSVTVFPLDWNIKALLRPNPGKPRLR